MTLEELEESFGWVNWRTPVSILVAGGEGGQCFACRVCIATNGIKATEVTDWPQTYQEWEEHFKTHLPPA